MYPAPPRVLDRRPSRATSCSRCSARPTSRRAAGPSSSTTGWSARAPCAGRRRPTPPCSQLPSPAARDRRLDRRQRPPRRLRPVPRRDRGRARVLGQPHLRRRRAARAHQLPQLRQPREAAHRVAAHAAVAGIADACRALERAGRRRQRLALQRGGRGPIYPTPVVGMVGELPDAARAGRLGFAHDGDAVALIAAGSWAPSADRLRAGQAARRAADRRAARTPTSASCGPARRGPPGRPLGRAALRPRHRRGRARRRAGRVLHRRRPRRDGRPRALPPGRRGAAVRRGPGRLRRLRPGGRCGRSAARRGIGTVGGSSWCSTRSRVPVAELGARPRARPRRSAARLSERQRLIEEVEGEPRPFHRPRSSGETRL